MQEEETVYKNLVRDKTETKISTPKRLTVGMNLGNIFKEDIDLYAGYEEIIVEISNIIFEKLMPI